MGSVSHSEDEKKELVKEVHQLSRLVVRLVDILVLNTHLLQMLKISSASTQCLWS